MPIEKKCNIVVDSLLNIVNIIHCSKLVAHSSHSLQIQKLIDHTHFATYSLHHCQKSVSSHTSYGISYKQALNVVGTLRL